MTKEEFELKLILMDFRRTTQNTIRFRYIGPHVRVFINLDSIKEKRLCVRDQKSGLYLYRSKEDSNGFDEAMNIIINYGYAK